MMNKFFKNGSIEESPMKIFPLLALQGSGKVGTKKNSINFIESGSLVSFCFKLKV